jgi:Flp pilus assembly protein TadD
LKSLWLFGLLLLTACAGQTSSPIGPPLSQVQLTKAQLLEGPDELAMAKPEVELLALDSEMRDFLSDHVPGNLHSRQKTRLLIESFFSGEGIDIQYDNIKTHTAIETFHRESGNCLSFTSLFVAMAREAGIKATFQEVETPPVWNNMGELYIYNRHINALVEYRTGPPQVVDFDIANFDENFPRKKISDRAALAQYHNNMSVHWMLKEDPTQALAHQRQSLVLAPQASYMWANLGALYSRFNYPDFAEAAYLQALQINSNEYVAISNLARFYRGHNEVERAQYYADRALRFRRKNPYYLYSEAQRNYELANYDEALVDLRRAIRLDDGEHNFHRLLGLVQLEMGQVEEAQISFEQAATLNAEPRYAAMYSRKLELLSGH